VKIHLKTSSDRQILLLSFKKSDSLNLIDIRILIENSKIAVSARAQYKFSQNSREQLA